MKLDRNDPLEARFARFVRRNERGKTGLKKSDQWMHICKKCKTTVTLKTSRPPQLCEGLTFMGEDCGSRNFESYNKVDVEAMPIGRVIIDLRSPSQMGRKGKTR
jgi:hypothetical protein